MEVSCLQDISLDVVKIKSGRGRHRVEVSMYRYKTILWGDIVFLESPRKSSKGLQSSEHRTPREGIELTLSNSWIQRLLMHQ